MFASLPDPPRTSTLTAYVRMLWRPMLATGLVTLLLVINGYVLWIMPPNGFPSGEVITIPEGITLSQSARWLEQEGVVRSGFALQHVVLLLAGEKSIQAGDYYFNEPLDVVAVAERLISGNYGLDPVRVTIPEGATTYQIADLLEKKLGRFDAVTFLAKARNKEGYLFPDTYFFLPNVTINHVISKMERNFQKRIEPLTPQVASSTRSLHEIITMASLLEKEARTTKTRRMIAGILWKRLEVDMPLQVDAVFGYINGTDTFHPTYGDLDIDSPYNTYRHRGLPPGPIANPGLDSIKAALNPIESDYLYYLTGRDGQMHYSEEFDEHVRNKQLYLN